MGAINYATQYQTELAQQFPYVLYFGALYNTPNNGRYRWVNSKTIEVPTISVTGRVDATRDTIATASRNYNNSWTPLTLSNERKWSTLVHPRDIEQTNMTATIANITRVMNEEQKFPEMDAYTISKLYADWTEAGGAPITDAFTADTILETFDSMLARMTEGRVPKLGLILYVIPSVYSMIKRAQGISRSLDVGKGTPSAVSRALAALDEVNIEEIPSELMKTLYDFTVGYKVASGAKQIKMMLINPLAVITPVSYEFAKLDPPSALSEGKYVYYEESHEDVFVLKNKIAAIQMAVEA